MNLIYVGSFFSRLKEITNNEQPLIDAIIRKAEKLEELIKNNDPRIKDVEIILWGKKRKVKHFSFIPDLYDIIQTKKNTTIFILYFNYIVDKLLIIDVEKL